VLSPWTFKEGANSGGPQDSSNRRRTRLNVSLRGRIKNWPRLARPKRSSRWTLEPQRDERVTPMAFPYIYRWDRQGRKGQPCRVLARGKMNSCLVEFADGYQMVTSRNAIGKAAVL
jgi:hypothetical protein